MAAVLTVLLVLALSLIVVRVATVGLTLTGLSRDLAQFQALSAFTRAGYTTREAEEIVNHPIRRRIVMHLMLLGNAGIVIAVASVISLFFSTTHSQHWTGSTWFRGLILGGGVILLWGLANSRPAERAMWAINKWALSHWTNIAIHDYTNLLRLARNFVVLEMHVRPGDWLAGKSLQELKLNSEGILVLGIERADGTYLGVPRGHSVIASGDKLILYGRQSTLVELTSRREGLLGNLHHVIAVSRQMDRLEEEPDRSKELQV